MKVEKQCCMPWCFKYETMGKFLRRVERDGQNDPFVDTDMHALQKVID